MCVLFESEMIANSPVGSSATLVKTNVFYAQIQLYFRSIPVTVMELSTTVDGVMIFK